MSYEQDWNDLAALDPFWAIMSDARHKHGRWDVDKFFATGENEVAGLMRQIAEVGAVPSPGAALDFGCGVGRTTRALASRFDRCVGLDVSLEMIKLARELNAAAPNCEFAHSSERGLSGYGDETFNLIYCNIVLQHLSDRAAIQVFLGEFMRVLAPDGILVFRLPSDLPVLVRLQPRRTLYGLLRRLGVSPRFLYFRLGLHPISMTAMPEADVRASLTAAGAETIAVLKGQDPNFEFSSLTYLVTRSAAAPATRAGSARRASKA